MHVAKHVKSSMQSGSVKQAWTSSQQLSAMQSPHGDPSDGHSERPQKPAMQKPEQHSSSPPHGEPSGEHCAPHSLSMQLLLQHSSNVWQKLPSGKQASTQSPPSQVPLQQSGPTLQKPPIGLHIMHSAPQMFSAMLTQMPSHIPLQQNPSWAQTALTQALQSGSSGSPTTHGPWGHSSGTEQKPPSQFWLQHSASPLQVAPLGVHIPHPQTCSASSTQMPSQKF
jgi:hypothetical protein